MIDDFPADGTEDRTASTAGQLDLAEYADEESQPEATDASSGDAGRGRMSLTEIKQRDELVTFSVRHLRMTAAQVFAFAKCWPHPFSTESDVWRRLKALKLDKRIRHVARQTLHDEWTLLIFVKIACDAVRNGFGITDIAKECRIGDDSGIRSDMRFRIGERLYFLETQHSALTYRGWKAKLGKYVRYRRRSEPFRVLIVMENENNLNTVVRYARDVMEQHPNLTLFYFAYMPDLMGQYDVVREDVWTTHRREPIALR